MIKLFCQWSSRSFAALVLLGVCSSAQATFHDIQIEQVIGGVNGDVTAQAIQLRMSSIFQNQMQGSRLIAFDANGNNPILIVDMTTAVPNQGAGVRVLIASENFVKLTSPGAEPDFLMTNLIPASYLAAGSLTFEQDPPFPIVYWRLSWGGAAYTGSCAGDTFNDSNGNFCPPFPGPMPSTTLQAVRFTGPASANSTSNAADYALTAGAAVFVNNAGQSFTVTGAATGACCLKDGSCLSGQTEAQCAASNGTFQGIGSSCSVKCPLPCPADITNDGQVNVNDLLAVINNWGPCGSCAADVTGDGQVNVNDLLAVINNWGPCR